MQGIEEPVFLILESRKLLDTKHYQIDTFLISIFPPIMHS